MTKLPMLISILAVIAISSGCSEIEGACEYYYSDSGSNRFYCSNESADGMALLDPAEAEDACFYGDANHLHEDSTCSDIGYNQEAYSSDTFKYNDDYDQSPSGYSGLGGYFGGSGGGGSGGGTSYNCNTVWTGSSSDVQVSTVCQGACSYANIGEMEAVDSYCQIIAGYGQSATNNCSVCP